MPSITYPMTPDVTRTAFSSGRERGRIGDRACHHLPQPLSLARDRIVHPAPKLLLDLPHLGPFAVAAGPPKEQKPAAPRPAADMGEAEEVERLRLAEPRPFPLLRRPAAELDQTGLVRMQGQRKLRQPIPQFRLEPLGIGLVLKAGNDVVGIAHQDDVSLGMVASPPLRPEIEDVMQVDVRQQGRGNAALRRARLRLGHLPVLHHPGLQPFADQANDAAVTDPVLDEADQPLVVDRIEEPGNVGVQYPVHPRVADPDGERVQCIVRTASGPEPVREPEEILLVDRVQHLDHRTLDDLVLQRCDAERALPAVRLWYVVPARWLRPVSSSMNAGVKIGELALEILAVLLPCHAVYTGRRIPLQPRVGAVKKPGIDMVEERGEPLLPIQPCSCPYTVQSRGHACPTRGPARVGSSRVLLGPLPRPDALRSAASADLRLITSPTSPTTHHSSEV